MQPRVTAIVIARRGGETLQQTLDALAQQSRHPDLLVVVDAATDTGVTAQLASSNPTQFVTAAPHLGFGELVARGLGALPAAEPSSSPFGGVEEWLWLLRNDSTPDPRALERLLQAVEIAPSVAVAGPKQLEAGHPTIIASYGETLTTLGASIALAEREIDQAQYDRVSDLLAVSEAGMLVRRQIFADVAGFDQALPSVDAALDLCVRIRLAGHRVVGVPQARMFVHETTPLAARPGPAPSISPRKVARAHRHAQLHRRLAYAPLASLPLHWLSMLPLAFGRSLGQLLRKRPTLVVGEFWAALAVAFSGTAVARSRRRLARARTLGWAAITPLRMAPDEVRRRRAIASDARLSAREDSRRPRPDFLPGGPAVIAVTAAIGAIAFAPLIGAPALVGGALAPLAPDLPALLDALHRASAGAAESSAAGSLAVDTFAADPFAFVLALLGLLTPWQPSLSLVVLWVAALPLAALTAWWAAAALVRRPAPAAVVALVWALSPTLLVALSLGRPAAVIAHIVLPIVIASAARAPRSWSATATAGISSAIVVAASPSLLPALVIAWLIWMLIHRQHIGRLLTLPVPIVALLAPLVVDQVLRGTPLGLLADPGLASAPGVSSPTALLLGWPGIGTTLDTIGSALPGLASTAVLITLAALSLPLVVVALLGLALPEGQRSVVPLALAVVGIVTAWGIGGIALTAADGQSIALDVGPALSLATLGVALAAGAALDGLGSVRLGSRRLRPARLATALGLLIALAATATAAPALAAIALGASVVRGSEVRTLPAIVAAEARDNPRVGTIVLTAVSAGDEAGIAARLERGAGTTLIAQRTFTATAGLVDGGGSDAELAFADLIGNLAAPSGRDLTASFDDLDVRFVLLTNPGTPEAVEASVQSVTAALDGNVALMPVGDTEAGRLWRVAADDSGAVGAAAAPDLPFVSSALLVTQLGILALTLLIALPTSFTPRRRRADVTAGQAPAPTFEADGDND